MIPAGVNIITKKAAQLTWVEKTAGWLVFLDYLVGLDYEEQEILRDSAVYSRSRGQAGAED
jgi:hypothetical protein